jgi:hypothetical protein
VDREESGLVNEALALIDVDLQIDNAAEYDYATAHLKDVRRMEKTIVEFFKPIKQKMDAAKREVLDREKAALKPVLEARRVVERQMSDYLDEIERQRKKEMKLAEQAAKREARKEKIDASLVPVEEPRTEVPKTEGISQLKYWDFEIVNPAKIHKSFLVPDEKKIRQVVKTMGPEAVKRIGGIRVFQKRTIKTRLT